MLKALTKKRGGWIEKSFITNSSKSDLAINGTTGSSLVLGFLLLADVRNSDCIQRLQD